MTQQIIVSGGDGLSFGQSLRKSLKEAKPRVVGIASAFVSNHGVKELGEIFRSCGQIECRLVAGTDKAITHPEALYEARKLGWKIRLGCAPNGIFHPKLILAGNRVSRSGFIGDLSCLYVGSSNLTYGGLKGNVECGLIAGDGDCPESASAAFAHLWKEARQATDAELRNYAARFAESARRRTARQLEDLGVNDLSALSSGTQELLKQRPTTKPVIGAKFAIAAWTGLQSFTGEYRFQVEFPKAAGEVIAQLVRGQKNPVGKIEVYCDIDHLTRRMQYKFYSNNSMFRLNIPNDVPGVEWARASKDGIAFVERGLQGGAALKLSLLKPGVDAQEIVERSLALGTWGRTSTRIYGWY